MNDRSEFFTIVLAEIIISNLSSIYFYGAYTRRTIPLKAVGKPITY
ncbi:hypothetical protein SPHINGO8BC_90381 [Sphingobacterium multivorum]|uniref:Uncharacterized protein n=1 Tax=Sphingobacterium multivorum TaxID=28454 RepID=A0A654DQP2_SPHMU|nr:hypothetical protein SPHINGO8BC_90381 [Sphingobacterium multivorum]